MRSRISILSFDDLSQSWTFAWPRHCMRSAKLLHGYYRYSNRRITDAGINYKCVENRNVIEKSFVEVLIIQHLEWFLLFCFRFYRRLLKVTYLWQILTRRKSYILFMHHLMSFKILQGRTGVIKMQKYLADVLTMMSRLVVGNWHVPWHKTLRVYKMRKQKNVRRSRKMWRTLRCTGFYVYRLPIAVGKRYRRRCRHLGARMDLPSYIVHPRRGRWIAGGISN